MKMKHLVEVEPATETAGPAYQNARAKDGLLQPPPGLHSCWDIFRTAVEKYPNNLMLGRRSVVDGKAGEYTWVTYKEVYDVVMKLAACTASQPMHLRTQQRRSHLVISMTAV